MRIPIKATAREPITQVEDLLTDIDANRGKCCSSVGGLLLRLVQSSLGRPLRGKQPVHPISGSSLRLRTGSEIHRILGALRLMCARLMGSVDHDA